MEISIAQNLIILIGFIIIAMAAANMGRSCKTIGLPLISGYILAGMLAGPHILDYIRADMLPPLTLIDGISLPFIAMAAGAELNLHLIQRQLRMFLIILSSILLTVITIGAIALTALAADIPFLADRPLIEVIAIALLGATILCAASPSSAIAVIKELRAKGTFTQKLLGVTVLMDVIIIVVFAVQQSMASMLIDGNGFHVNTILVLCLELLSNICFGIILSQAIRLLLSTKMPSQIKALMILAAGAGLYFLPLHYHEAKIFGLNLHLLSEPLLYWMVVGFIVRNFTRHHGEFIQIIEKTAPIIFVLFFTFLGASMEVELLLTTWRVLLVVAVVRAVALYLGAFIGDSLSGASGFQKHYLGLSFLTPAGLSLGLAKEVGHNFPDWGVGFATFFVALIALNTLIGPAFLKIVIHLSGEAHSKAEPSEVDHIHEALIVGIEPQALMLARTLQQHGWKTILADLDPRRVHETTGEEIAVKALKDISEKSLRDIGAHQVGAIVSLLDDQSSFKLCEIAYEHFGTPNLVVHLQTGNDLPRFRELGVAIVHSGSAIVNLLDHCVRSPSTAALFLGQDQSKDMVEIKVANPSLHGLALRDLQLPGDALIVAIRRHEQLLVSHGYSRLRFGDLLTIIGTPECLNEIETRLAS